MLTVVGKITAKHEALDNVRSELMTLVGRSRKESGCVHYSLYQDNGNPDVLVVYEKWESKDALDAHMNTDHFKECFSTIDGSYHGEVHLLSELA